MFGPNALGAIGILLSTDKADALPRVICLAQEVDDEMRQLAAKRLFAQEDRVFLVTQQEAANLLADKMRPILDELDVSLRKFYGPILDVLTCAIMQIGPPWYPDLRFQDELEYLRAFVSLAKQFRITPQAFNEQGVRAHHQAFRYVTTPEQYRQRILDAIDRSGPQVIPMLRANLRRDCAARLGVPESKLGTWDEVINENVFWSLRASLIQEIEKNILRIWPETAQIGTPEA